MSGRQHQTSSKIRSEGAKAPVPAPHYTPSRQGNGEAPTWTGAELRMQSYPAEEEATLTVSPTYLKRGDRWEGKQSGTSPWLLAWRRTAPQQRLFKVCITTNTASATSALAADAHGALVRSRAWAHRLPVLMCLICCDSVLGAVFSLQPDFPRRWLTGGERTDPGDGGTAPRGVTSPTVRP